MQGKLKTTRFPDGTGSIGLIAGWRLDSQARDSIIVSGPDGASLHLGQYGSTIQPAAVQFGAESSFTVVQDLSDPIAATAAFVEQASRRAGRPMRLRVLEARPIPGGGMRAVALHYRIEGAVLQEGFGLFAAGPVGGGMGMTYASFAVAPPAGFKRHLPAMLAIWRSRRVNAGHPAFTELPAEVALKMRTLEAHGKEVRKLL